MIWFAAKFDCGSYIITMYIGGEILDEFERSAHGFHQFGNFLSQIDRSGIVEDSMEERSSHCLILSNRRYVQWVTSYNK